MELLTGLLLDEQMVFVHDNPTITTSVIFALKLLLRPFQYPHVLVSVLPSALLCQVECIVPFVMGISRRQFAEIAGEEDDFSQDEIYQGRTWVFLDKQKIDWSEYWRGEEVTGWYECFAAETKDDFAQFSKLTF